MTRYWENTRRYLSDTFTTYLELRTGKKVSIEDKQDIQHFFDKNGVSYRRSHHLNYPPKSPEELGELIKFSRNYLEMS